MKYTMQRLNAILLTIIGGFVCVTLIVIVNRDQKRSIHLTTNVFTANKPQRLRADEFRGPWPRPRHIHVYNDYHFLNRNTFRFKLVNNTRVFNCDILLNAISRYNAIIFSNSTFSQTFDVKELHSLDILVKGDCEKWPHFDMDESYTLDIVKSNQLVSKTIWGALRGLETFSQLVYKQKDQIAINKTFIEDKPRFKHRGLLVDTARHFMPMPVLLRNLDAMTYNKFNVFHWHIVDDNSFPYESRTYPSLSEKGAYNKHTHVYRQRDVQTLLEYARLRGIRVIVEFDTPGHTLSWGKGVEDLVIDCRTLNREYSGLSLKGGGVLQVSKPTTYEFLINFFREVTETFPDEYIHIGGDEVATECWQKTVLPNQNVNQNENLYDFYMNRFSKIINQLNKKYIVWQEVYEENLRIHPDAIIQVWKSWTQPDDLIRQIVEQGKRVISSNAWYLDMISYKKDWIDYYNYDPTKYVFNSTQQKLIVGGEACVWSEYVDETNLLSRTWPRASAVAERLWSPKDVVDIDDASNRFNAFRCLLKERGIPAHPINGPDYCETFVLSSIDTPHFEMNSQILYLNNLKFNEITYLLLFVCVLLVIIVFTPRSSQCFRK